MNWFETILYGIVSGLTEFMPVSSYAHQMLIGNIFGFDGTNHILSLFVHIGMFAGLFVAYGNTIINLYKQYRLGRGGRRRRGRSSDLQAVYDIHFVQSAFLPMVVGFILYPAAMKWINTVPWTCIFLLINGIILHVPMYMARGNKDSRSMSAVDGTLFGFGAALGILPGVSRVGVASSIAVGRGADAQHVFKWSLLLSVPALLGWIAYDLYGIVTVGLSGADIAFLIKCVLSGGASLLGTVLSVSIVKSIVKNSGFSGFSYYSWGAALFMFILYLY